MLFFKKSLLYQDDSLPERCMCFFFSWYKRGCSTFIHQRALGFNSTMFPPQDPSVRCQGWIAAYLRLQESPKLWFIFVNLHVWTHILSFHPPFWFLHAQKEKGETHKQRQEIKCWSKDAFGALKQSFVDIHLVSSTKFRCIDWMQKEGKERK